MVISMLEWSSCAFGLMGAFLLALNSRISCWGWWLFLAANVVTMTLALKLNLYGLLVQQMGFCATSVLGLVRSGFFRRF